jgi:predicted permease
MPDFKQLVREKLAGSSLSPVRENEIIEELSDHLADRYQEMLNSRMSEDAAYRAVSQELAAHELIQQLQKVEEAAVEAPTLGARSGGNLLFELWYDLRYAVRLLRLNPTFTVVAVLSLALGIGANTAIFELLNAVRLRTLPVKDPQQLALIKLDTKDKGITGEGIGGITTFAQYEQVRDRNEGFLDLAAWGNSGFDLNTGGEVRNARGLYVSGNYFGALGVDPALGRLINPSDDVRGCGAPGVVISYPFWRHEYAQDASVIGKSITLDGHPFTLLGVTAPDFFGMEVGRQFDVAIPICAEALMRPEHSALTRLDTWWLTMVGRLKPGWTVERTSAQLQAISASVMQQTLPPQYNAEDKKDYLAFQFNAIAGETGTSSLRRVYDSPLLLLLAITALVLLIACANLANLMLARASAREREIAIRLALGAARGRLIRQLLTESLLIACAGAAAGLVIAHNVSRIIISLLSTQNRPVFIDLSLDWRMFAFTALLAMITCVLFGLAPALRATKAAPSRAMNASGRSVISSREKNGLRRGLVVTQVALSLVLMITALLFVRSLRHLMHMDVGFQREGILIAYVDMTRLNLSKQQRLDQATQMLDSIRHLPGVQAAAQTNIVPVAGYGWNENILVGGKKQGLSDFMRTSPGYFGTVGTPILLGRDFDERDSAKSPKVAIVTERFAEKLLKTPNAIGMSFEVHSYEDRPAEIYQIVGIVKDSKYRDVREEFQPLAYVPAAQDENPDGGPAYVLRGALPMETLTAEVKEAVMKMNPSISIDFRVFNTQITESLARERMLATLSGFFGVLAGVLAMIGIYGVISYMVIRRTNEIGIRMALGATRANIVRLILSEAGMLLGIGLVIGTALAAIAGRAAASLLYGLKSTDIATYGMAIALLTTVTCAATLLPAGRAAKLDPMVALRDE